jgi:hypothetical protein
MQLPNPKDLKVLLKLCRTQGVQEISIGEMTIKFGDLPMVAKGGEMIPADEDPEKPTDEEMLFWSAQPDPLAARQEIDQ